jgi:hypothetical protein
MAESEGLLGASLRLGPAGPPKPSGTYGKNMDNK